MPKVRDAIRLVERDGWKHVRTRGSHRHYRHPTKLGIVTIAGKLSKELAPKTWNSILKQAKIQEGDQT
ncbi:MAG: type II toxin-antitoxin system HicA family toxin [Chloroflexi bacterium]|nr:type II toxin-antitoxin system HicA family toxin [Chloroflexota bacterium]